MVASGGGNKVKQETKLPKVFFWAISNNDIARTFSFFAILTADLNGISCRPLFIRNLFNCYYVTRKFAPAQLK